MLFRFVRRIRRGDRARRLFVGLSRERRRRGERSAAAASTGCTDVALGGVAAACNMPDDATFEEAFMAHAMVLCGGS